jgi:hypothetical protein
MHKKLPRIPFSTGETRAPTAQKPPAPAAMSALFFRMRRYLQRPADFDVLV